MLAPVLALLLLLHVASGSSAPRSKRETFGGGIPGLIAGGRGRVA